VPSDWARDFEEWNRRVLLSEETEKLIDYRATGELADFSAPPPDHYLPLLYLAALRETTDQVSFPVEGFDGGTMSMLSVQLTSHTSAD